MYRKIKVIDERKKEGVNMNSPKALRNNSSEPQRGKEKLDEFRENKEALLKSLNELQKEINRLRETNPIIPIVQKEKSLNLPVWDIYNNDNGNPLKWAPNEDTQSNPGLKVNYVPPRDEFQEVTEKMHDTYLKKNSDYGSSFDKTWDKYGLQSLVIRLSDKLNRLESLSHSKTPQVVNESIEDTLLDLANYAILGYLKIKKN